MADVREMRIAGGQKIATLEKQLAGGHAAQGFALAQTVIAATISTAQQLRMACETAFDYSIEAREAAIKALNDWKREATKSAKENSNLLAGKVEARDLGRIARSAATRVSEFSAVVKAMNNGMTRESLRELAGVADPENIGFHTLVVLARRFSGSSAAGGRPADPFAVALAKWLAKQNPTGADAEVKDRVVNMLAAVLPVPAEAEPIAEGIKQAATHRRAADAPVH